LGQHRGQGEGHAQVFLARLGVEVLLGVVSWGRRSNRSSKGSEALAQPARQHRRLIEPALAQAFAARAPAPAVGSRQVIHRSDVAGLGKQVAEQVAKRPFRLCLKR
jgi:hypothetical protein